MAEWKRLCPVAEAPRAGEVTEAELGGVTLCLANRDGRFSVLENECPHRGGPLGQGWMEGNTVLCPWHAWAFDLDTGVVEPPEHGSVKVYPVRIEGEQLEAYIE